MLNKNLGGKYRPPTHTIATDPAVFKIKLANYLHVAASDVYLEDNKEVKSIKKHRTGRQRRHRIVLIDFMRMKLDI